MGGTVALTKLAELPIGDDERAKGSKAFQSLVGMSLRRLAVNWRFRARDSPSLEMFGLPDQVLEQVPRVFGEE